MQISNLMRGLAAGTIGLSMTACAQLPSFGEKDTSHIQAAIESTARPAKEIEADGRRKPAEMLSFAGIEPGMLVADFIPGQGYFTRIFSGATGPDGKVFALTPMPESGQPQLDDIMSDTANYANVTRIPIGGDGPLTVPGQVDILWTSQNYHDLKNLPPPYDIAETNAELFSIVKPGGVFIVLDHTAAEDAPDDVTNTLHRIRKSVVISELTAAGFELDGESDALTNADDPLDLNVFNDAIRGRTDQFILKFRKPAE